MRTMFQNCSNLTTLDLSNWNTNKVTDMNYMFTNMHKLQQITLGANFKFKGTATTPATGSLPTPNKNYITGADGKWYNIATQVGYTAEAVAQLPSGEARTFSAIAPVAQALYLDADKSLRFVKTQPLTTEDKYDGKADEFIEFISDPEIAVPGTYQKTWDYIEKDKNSLERHTNMGLIFD